MLAYLPHTPGAIAWCLICASLPFWAISVFGKRLHPDTDVLATTFYALLFLAGMVSFFIADFSEHDAHGYVGEVIDIGTSALALSTAYRVWCRWFRQHAEALR